VAVDADGNTVIADTGGFRVRVVAARAGTFYGRPMTAGDVYTVAGNGTFGFGSDGHRAVRSPLAGPQGVAVDATGNLFIADANNGEGAGVLRVVAARTGTIFGRRMKAGYSYIIAESGGPNQVGHLHGVAVDASGNALLANQDFGIIEAVAASTGTFYGQAMTAGQRYVVAGGGTGGLGDGGPATSAELSSPQGVAVDAAGNLLIADTNDQRIRVVAERTGTFYGQAMTAGNIYTIAGNGTSGFSGDGHPASSAELSGPSAVAVDPAGNLLIADAGNNRIRAVTP
jgi:DNA-binding beta-propeller fold protein YncE